MGADCKSVGLAFEGSNPSPATSAPGLHRPGAFARSAPRSPASVGVVTGDGGQVIETTGLTKHYGQVHALTDLDIEVGEGVTGLVGANGAGKSTLIKILLGLLEPTAGGARVLGHDIATGGEEIRRLVGYMPEHDCLPPDVSASEFVVHMARMSGLGRSAARERSADVLRHVGLDEERYRPMGGYSTGMKQRAKLAQALVHDPRLVFLDEPTNGLDPAGAHRHARPRPPHRQRLRHRRARHLPPARRARAGQRPRRRPRRRPPAALQRDRRLPRAAPAACSSRWSAATAERDRFGRGAGRGRPHLPAARARPSRWSRRRPGSACTTWSATPPPTSASA